MRVRDLIELLSEYADDDKVYYADDGGWMHELFIGEDNYEARDIITIEGLPERITDDDD